MLSMVFPRSLTLSVVMVLLWKNAILVDSSEDRRTDRFLSSLPLFLSLVVLLRRCLHVVLVSKVLSEWTPFSNRCRGDTNNKKDKKLEEEMSEI